ncbi:MAG: GDSL-type esterase/lipase family protein [Verrucomicrobiales bacterium]|nr:GDSL-type esterase/lipase family protein [Verrucomicrobiales bacterium]
MKIRKLVIAALIFASGNLVMGQGAHLVCQGGGAAKEVVEGEPEEGAGMRKLEDFELKAGDRVLFLGGTAIERSARYGYLETALQASLGGDQVVFRNLGWSGDDVKGSSRGRFGFQPEGFRHLKQHVEDLKPTVIFVDYGRNEAFEGADGLAEFQRGFGGLLDVLEATGAKLVLTGPYRQEALGGKLPDPTVYNSDLGEYVEVIRKTADRRGHWFLNLYAGLEMRVEAGSETEALTYNGIHLTEVGYRRMAEVVSVMLGEGVPDWEVVEAMRKTVVKKNEQFFQRWRPQNETYLTLFRKHEQGNNYREIPEFDPIIAGLEKEIAAKAAAYQQEVKP